MPNLTREQLSAARPEGGLFADRDWLASPRPFTLTKKEAKFIERLGHPLAMFQRACDQIYRRSAKGSLPNWISEYLDIGKPSWMVDVGRSTELVKEIPRVLRPDLLLTEDGFAMSELDSLPGGIGVTAWLSQTYATGGFDVLGGANGMVEGFRSVLPAGGRILVSEESGDYRPEMEWLAKQLGSEWSSGRAEDEMAGSEAIYRFFELFDWEAIPGIRDLARRTIDGSIELTPPIKAQLEEKLWLALFWSPALRGVWEEELRGSHLQRLREIIPFGWVVDPTPIPPHAVLPRLDVNSWNDVAEFSQKKRRLVLKVSGFSEEAWGSKGVFIGHDLSSSEWTGAMTRATNEAETQPWIMQEFADARIVKHPYFDAESGEERIMEGRVRLCPYYFVGKSGKTNFGGALATIVPADKKKIHGMKDGILVPCVVEE